MPTIIVTLSYWPIWLLPKIDKLDSEVMQQYYARGKRKKSKQFHRIVMQTDIKLQDQGPNKILLLVKTQYRVV